MDDTVAEGKEKKWRASFRRAWAELRSGQLNDPLGRAFLGALAVAALVLAASEGHEAIGSALVGAAIAFGLGAAFFDRVEELGPRGVRLRKKLERFEELGEEELAEADPTEREEVLAEGRGLILAGSEKGEPVSPEGALREARRELELTSMAVESRFSRWLASNGWKVDEPERFVGAGRPDLVAERDGRTIAVEVKVGRRPLGAAVVDQVIGLAVSVKPTLPEDVVWRDVEPVLVVRGTRLSATGRSRAEAADISVYEIDEAGEVLHLLGPELG